MEKYKYFNMGQLQEVAENLVTNIEIGDFYRTGVEIYVGSFPDVSGPDLVIDPCDREGIELFKEFASKLAAHYRTIRNYAQ